MSPRAPAGTGPSAAALLALVAANLVPLVGVLFFGWSLFEVLLIYWLESGVIGLYNVPRILLAQGDPGARGWHEERSGRPERNTLPGRIGMMGFFLVHYGGFWAGHFLLLLVAFDPKLFPTEGAAESDPYAFPLTVAMLFVSHGLSFAFNYLGRGEYRTALPGSQMWAPYGRVLTFQIAALGGGALAARLGSPVWALAVLVALKTVVDAGTHVWAHAARTG